MSFRGLRTRHPLRRSVVLVLGLAIATGACGSSGTTNEISTKSTTVPVSASSTTTSPGASTTVTSDRVPTPSTPLPTTTSPASAPVTAPAPGVPTGPFLNSHTLSLGGVNAPSAGQSVCKTSPGANCEVRFTNGAGSHVLGAKVAGPDGIVHWSWTPADVGLTVGHWRVEIVATRGALTASTSDPLGLQVVP